MMMFQRFFFSREMKLGEMRFPGGARGRTGTDAHTLFQSKSCYVGRWMFSLCREVPRRDICVGKKKHVSREREEKRMVWLVCICSPKKLGRRSGQQQTAVEENNVVGERMCIHMPCMPSGIRARGFSRALREDYSARVTGRKGSVRAPDFLLNICYVFHFWKSQP